MAERRLTIMMPETIHVDGIHCGESCEHESATGCGLFYDSLAGDAAGRTLRCPDCLASEVKGTEGNDG